MESITLKTPFIRPVSVIGMLHQLASLDPQRHDGQLRSTVLGGRELEQRPSAFSSRLKLSHRPCGKWMRLLVFMCRICRFEGSTNGGPAVVLNTGSFWSRMADRSLD